MPARLSPCPTEHMPVCTGSVYSTYDATEFFALADGDDDWRVVQLTAVLLLLYRGDTCQEQRGQILTAFAPRWFAVCFVARTVWASIRKCCAARS